VLQADVHLSALQQHFRLSLEIARGDVQAFGLGKIRQGGRVIATVAAKGGTPQIRRGGLCIACDGLRVGGFGASKIGYNLPRPTEIHACMTRLRIERDQLLTCPDGIGGGGAEEGGGRL
jgi:hypothetical protein